MSGQKYIAYAALPSWLTALAREAVVYAPRREGKAVVYRPYSEGDMPEQRLRPTESAKHAVFPRSEALFTFRREGEPENPGQRKLSLREPEEPGRAIVFGALSCDARGFFAFDPVYDGSGTSGYPSGAFKDPYYLKRREKTLLIVRACARPLATCFCHWVGGDPASEQGADVLATDVEGGLVLRALTDKGAELLSGEGLLNATQEQEEAAASAHAAARALMGDAPDLAAAPEALRSLFENAAFWSNESAHCLSCGACTYLCPTCYCFNITDESNGIAGARIRSWDTCMSPLFTLEASGHNPRNGKAARLKNRVGHKFSYYPGLHGGRFSCCGCGRCIKSCPSSVDIRKIVLEAIKEAAHG